MVATERRSSACFGLVHRSGTPLALFAATSLVLSACGPPEPHASAAAGALPDCEWCGADEAPADPGWQITIPPEDEPGEPLVITGTVYRTDARTPAQDVILYVYHTNSRGVYPKRGDETGNGRRHGYLRGWIRTGADGRYRFTTIRPAAYPSRSEAAHIHMTVKEPGRDEYWIDSIKFEDDPLLTPQQRTRQTGRGGPGTIPLTRDAGGTWHGTRDIILEPEE